MEGQGTVMEDKSCSDTTTTTMHRHCVIDNRCLFTACMDMINTREAFTRMHREAGVSHEAIFSQELKRTLQMPCARD